MYVRFTDLLDDWRDVVGRVAGHLDVPLDAERARRRGRSLSRATTSHSSRRATPRSTRAAADPRSTAIRALYRECLARCDRDAASPRPVPRRMHHRASRGVAPATKPRDGGFVLCIENNAIRDQALLLCESIRRFAGRYSAAPIMAFAPRPGLGVDAATRRALEEMDVEYFDEPLNTTCHEYAPANRVFAGGYAEAHSDTDFLVVLDSDTRVARRTGVAARRRCRGAAGRFQGQRDARARRSLRGLLGDDWRRCAARRSTGCRWCARRSATSTSARRTTPD